MRLEARVVAATAKAKAIHSEITIEKSSVLTDSSLSRFNITGCRCHECRNCVCIPVNQIVISISVRGEGGRRMSSWVGQDLAAHMFPVDTSRSALPGGVVHLEASHASGRSGTLGSEAHFWAFVGTPWPPGEAGRPRRVSGNRRGRCLRQCKRRSRRRSRASERQATARLPDSLHPY